MYIQEKGANRNICQQVCCITFGETSSGPVFGNEIEKKRFLDMLLNAIQDLKINVYAYCVLDYEAYILATAAVSYTHLDVYKRQVSWNRTGGSRWMK